MPTYQIVSEDTIKDDSGRFIPVDPLNADYQDYLAWVAAGNTATNFTPPSNTDTVYIYGNSSVGNSEVYDATNGSFLYNNNGVLGERATTGSSAVVLSQGATIANATIHTPTITGNLYAGSTPYQGDANSVLTATGTGVEWNFSSGIGDVVRNITPTITGLELVGTLTAGGGAGTSGQLLSSTSTGVQWLTLPYQTTLTKSVASVTTSDVTGAINTLHYLDISGLTANRYLNLPTPTAIGQRCVVYISTGSASYSLIPYNATGSVELARLLINGEYMSFIATDTSVSGWVTEIDGRKPCVARLTYTGSGQSITSGSSTLATLNTSAFDNASICDTTNSRLKIRRTGRYMLTAGLRLTTTSAAMPRYILSIRQTDTAGIFTTMEISPNASSLLPGIALATVAEVSEGKTIDLLTFQNSGSSQTTVSTQSYQHLALAEIFT
jgi:hypothetical protein